MQLSETEIFYLIGKCILLHKKTSGTDAQLHVVPYMARNKSCAAKRTGCERVRNALLNQKVAIYEKNKEEKLLLL